MSLNSPEPNIPLPELEAKQLEQARNQITILEGEKQRISGIIRDLKVEITSLLSEKDAVVTSSEVLKQQKEVLEASVNDLTDKKVALESEIKTSSETIASTYAELSEKEIEIQEKSAQAQKELETAQATRLDYEEKLRVHNVAVEEHNKKVESIKEFAKTL